MAKTPTFLDNFCEGVKIYHFSNEIIFGHLLQTFGGFFWSHCLPCTVAIFIFWGKCFPLNDDLSRPKYLSKIVTMMRPLKETYEGGQVLGRVNGDVVDLQDDVTEVNDVRLLREPAAHDPEDDKKFGLI